MELWDITVKLLMESVHAKSTLVVTSAKNARQVSTTILNANLVHVTRLDRLETHVMNSQDNVCASPTLLANTAINAKMDITITQHVPIVNVTFTERNLMFVIN